MHRALRAAGHFEKPSYVTTSVRRPDWHSAAAGVSTSDACANLDWCAEYRHHRHNCNHHLWNRGSCGHASKVRYHRILRDAFTAKSSSVHRAQRRSHEAEVRHAVPRACTCPRCCRNSGDRSGLCICDAIRSYCSHRHANQCHGQFGRNAAIFRTGGQHRKHSGYVDGDRGNDLEQWTVYGPDRIS